MDKIHYTINTLHLKNDKYLKIYFSTFIKIKTNNKYNCAY